MAELEADCLKTSRTLWLGRHHKAEFAAGGDDAIQAKGKKTKSRSFRELTSR